MSIKYLRYIVLIVGSLVYAHGTNAAELQPSNLHLMPMPKSIILGQGKLPVDSAFTVHLTGHKDPRISGAVSRMLQRLQRKTGIPISPTHEGSAGKATLEIHCTGPAERTQSIQANESYTLEVTEKAALLAAPSPIGILRGLETFIQLLDVDQNSFFVPVVQIRDEPRFVWRGLLIDASRHWQPADVIIRNLDAMAAVKMNVLHWHLSDDQGFRLESQRFPKLHQLGSDGNYYTQQEVRKILAYARDRGIRIVPEFDMPGHTTSWLVAYPELASAPGLHKIERAWGIFDPTMDPTDNRLYSFLDSFIGEVAELFPDEYLHIGGDEVSGKQWNSSSKIQSFKKQNHLADNSALQAYFNQRLQKILEKHRKKMIGWDEILHPNLPKTAMIQSWRGQSYLAKSARQGYAGILSFGYYLDQMQPASFHYGIDPLNKETANLSDAEKSRILGGEACMWGEYITPDNIDSRIWPRTAAIAERLWSAQEIVNVDDMYRRLEFMDRELASSGLRHRSSYIEMLRRMIGDENITPLKILADLLKPLGLSPRHRTRVYSSLVPLNRMVDTVLPESDAARCFGSLVNKAIANPAAEKEAILQARKLLSAWRENADALKPLIKQSFLLKEISPLSEIVSELSGAGLEALVYLESRQTPPAQWKESTARLIDLADKPQAETMVAIVPTIKALVEAANAIVD